VVGGSGALEAELAVMDEKEAAELLAFVWIEGAGAEPIDSRERMICWD